MPISARVLAALTVSRVRRSGLLCVACLLHGCGSSGPTQPESPASEIAEIGVEVEPRQSRAQRRRAERRGAREEGAGDEAGATEPVPEEATRAYDRALAAMLGGDDTEAELQLEQFVLEYPGYAGPYVNLAILHRRNDRTADAEEALERALAVAPGHPAANNQLGILHRTEGRFAEAEEAYRRAIEADPAYVLAYYNLGVLLDLYLKRPAEALENYERFQELQAEPDETVGRWIIDLRRRVGATDRAARVAQEDAP